MNRVVSVLGTVFVWSVAGFLILPVLLAIVLSLSSQALLAFPPRGISLEWYARAWTNAQFQDGFRVSIATGLAVGVLATVCATPAAIALYQGEFRGRPILSSLLLSPLVLPAVVTGLSLLQTLSLYGLRPGPMAVVLGHTVITLPYAVRLVLATLSNYDISLDRASLSLGASYSMTLRRITLPLIRPGIVAAGIFSFLLSFDNVALSIFLAAGDTLPLRLLQHMQFYADPSVAAVSVFLVALSVAAWAAVQRLSRGGAVGRLL